jgi:CubicO group peptidase (beta-lactamase class C family)
VLKSWLSIAVGSWVWLGILSAEQPPRTSAAETIGRMLVELHEHGEFTGSVLVAREGAVMYRDAIAATPDEAATLLATPAIIASLSKGFTAMTVMMLAERRKLGYDDPVGRHIPELAGALPGVTIRHLLTHTSGIPDVGDLGVDRPGVRERDVVDAIRTHQARFARPGIRFRYSNAGYILLAMIVENASQRTFDQYLQTEILEPLGMRSTRPDPGPRGPDDTKGDGGLLSTVDDLLKWDRALATNTLVRADTLRHALVPAKVVEGESTYAFGWNVSRRGGDTYMWHTGNAQGQRAFIGRRLRERTAVIILTRGNSRRVEIADAIVNILHGRPYEPPPLSIGRRVLAIAEREGLDAALAAYEHLRTAEPKRYDFSEPELNGVGYTLLDRGRHADAIRVFELNVRQFPTSSNVFDSLGEAFFRAGRRAEALRAYSRALELDPANVNARTMIEKLK